MAYLENEDGAERMIELFQLARDSGKILLLSVVNWEKEYYDYVERGRPGAR